jgi:hypothetical protein
MKAASILRGLVPYTTVMWYNSVFNCWNVLKLSSL